MTLDPKGPKTHSNVTQVQAKTNETQAKTSYARMAQQTQFPKKDQAVVTEVIDNLTIKDYTLAIGKIVKPTNVLFVARISNGRICIYLSSQDQYENKHWPTHNYTETTYI